MDDVLKWIHPDFYNDKNITFENDGEKQNCIELLTIIKNLELPKPKFAITDHYHPNVKETHDLPFYIKGLTYSNINYFIRHIQIDIEKENDSDDTIIYSVIFRPYLYSKNIYLEEFKLSGDLPFVLTESIKGNICPHSLILKNAF